MATAGSLESGTVAQGEMLPGAGKFGMETSESTHEKRVDLRRCQHTDNLKNGKLDLGV
jgi:hypothetical protein